jgi:hypothetical protein
LTQTRRAELLRLLASPALIADARAGDRDAQRALEEARDELCALERPAEPREAAA